MANIKTNRLVSLILCLFTWFIGAIVYLLWCKPKGLELIICILAIFIPIIPAIILWLNAFNVISLNK